MLPLLIDYSCLLLMWIVFVISGLLMSAGIESRCLYKFDIHDWADVLAVYAVIVIFSCKFLSALVSRVVSTTLWPLPFLTLFKLLSVPLWYVAYKSICGLFVVVELPLCPKCPVWAKYFFLYSFGTLLLSWDRKDLCYLLFGYGTTLLLVYESISPYYNGAK